MFVLIDLNNNIIINKITDSIKLYNEFYNAKTEMLKRLYEALKNYNHFGFSLNIEYDFEKFFDNVHKFNYRLEKFIPELEREGLILNYLLDDHTVFLPGRLELKIVEAKTED